VPQTFMYPGLSLVDRMDTAVARIQAYKPQEPYWGCFSGGKDSVVIKALAKLAGVPVDWHYNVTTIDPPELVRFIKRHHPDVTMERPKRNFFKAMVTRGIPTRRVRWCCEEFKESRSPRGATLLMGVRAAESPRRKKTWGVVTMHTKTRKNAINPIIDWPDDMVWRFIGEQGLEVCSLYDEGFKRLGCIGCPMGRATRIAAFKRWPRYEAMWKKGVKAAWDHRQGKEWFGNKFDTWQDLWDWWLSDRPMPKDEECQGMVDMLH
jgi:phosphoadenosine phosphosulfate reductase